MENTELQEKQMTMISYSGVGRSLAFEALEMARNGNYEKADKFMKQSEEKLLVAHNLQSAMLASHFKGNPIEMDMLMVHAQDHLMCAILAQDLIHEIIELHRSRLFEKENA